MRFNKFVFWTPRVLSIIFIFLVFLMSFDVFKQNNFSWKIILGFLIHNIPTFLLIILLIISWKKEIVGGIGFILAGLIYAGLILKNIILNGFKWYYLNWILQISGICFFIGVLFLINWKQRLIKKSKK